jgi:hypothetical protein
LERLGEEPSEGEEGTVMIIFRKPVGNERLQRRFRKTDLIERLYDFIDLEGNNVGFEMAPG